MARFGRRGRFHRPLSQPRFFPAIVQTGDDATGGTGVSSGASATCFANNTGIGHGVIAVIPTRSATLQDITSVTSAIGNFERVGAYTSTFHDIEIWCCRSSTGNAKSITVTLADAVTYFVGMIELSQPITGFYFGGGAGGTSITSATDTVTPLNIGDFLVAGWAANSTLSGAPSSPWTNYTSTAGSTYWKPATQYNAMAYQFANSLSLQSAAWTIGSSGSIQSLAAGFVFHPFIEVPPSIFGRYAQRRASFGR